ncbi:TetR/AcrR family transcriptional regulator [Phenylobacterium sp.]|uniref:TetR/AcrR family transcriptional regulator n=1 Tax=Phenylobacterium sp. TaxID=1871053 RepID=UPI00356258C1
MTSVSLRSVDRTRIAILDAAKSVLRERGCAGLSTRDVASAADVPLSQIHYHFGSKQGLIIAVFEHQNAQLLDRQTALYADPTMPISAQWELACNYLDDDLASGYVRVLMELWAAGWSDPGIARVVKDGVTGWIDLLSTVARRAETQFGSLGPFSADDIAALVGAAFIGAEAALLLELESEKIPIRQALRRVGAAIKILESGRG